MSTADTVAGRGPADSESNSRSSRAAAVAEQIAALERPDDGRGQATGFLLADAGDETMRKQLAEAKAICLRLLAVAPRPRAGLAQALQRKEVADDVAQVVLDRLTEVGLIDDVAYANSFVRVKHRDRALGRGALRTELRKLGVDEESMAAAVETVDAAAEQKRATELIGKRLDAAMAAGPVAAQRRMLGLLARRGYPPDIAIRVVEEAVQAYSEQGTQW